MRSRRAYRPPLSREEALKEIRDNTGAQFGPRVAGALLEVLKDNEE